MSNVIAKLRQSEPPYAQWMMSVAAGFTFAVVALFSLSSPINHFSTIDPVLYQSYIHNYREVIDLYGYTYYSTRISWIFPAALAQNLFGDIPGYYAVRILLLGSAASAFSILVGRFCRWQIAIYAAAWFCFFPYILRGFAHDYVDGAALSYGVMAMACVLTARPKAYLQHLAGGGFFALSINAYPIAALMALSCAIPWFTLRKDVREDVNIGHMGMAVAGFALAYGVIGLLLRQEFSAVGRPFELIPLSTIRSLAGGASDAYRISLTEVFVQKGEYFKALPLLLFAALVMARIAIRRSAPTLSGDAQGQANVAFALAALCGSIVAIYATLHFGLKAGSISVPFVYIFALPACGLGSLFLLNLLVPPRHLNAVCALGGLALLAVLLADPLADGLQALPGAVWMVGGLVLLTAGAAALYPGAKALRVVAIVAIVLFPLSFYDDAYGGCGYVPGKTVPSAGTESYVSCMRQDAAFEAEKDLRAGVLQLLDDVDAKVPLDHPPGLWYANGTGYADVVGSAFLWMYSRVGSTEADDPGMPVINAFAREKIDGYDYLVLIGGAWAEVDAGQKSLASTGYAFTPVLERKAGGDDFSFVYRIIKKQPAARPVPAGD